MTETKPTKAEIAADKAEAKAVAKADKANKRTGRRPAVATPARTLSTVVESVEILANQDPKDVPRGPDGAVSPPTRDADGNVKELPRGRGTHHRIEYHALQNPNDLPKDVNGKLLPVERSGPKLKDGEKVESHPLDDNRVDGAMSLLMRTPPSDVTTITNLKSPRQLEQALVPRPVDPPPVKITAASKAKGDKAAVEARTEPDAAIADAQAKVDAKAARSIAKSAKKPR